MSCSIMLLGTYVYSSRSRPAYLRGWPCSSLERGIASRVQSGPVSTEALGPDDARALLFFIFLQRRSLQGM